MARKAAPMVAEDDPQFARFWQAYPDRVAKKEARVAWLQVNPDEALVSQMLATLDWQKALWAKQGYGMPYPASWLRAERWTDEPPLPTSAKAVPAATDPWWYASCPHTPKCGGFRECGALIREAMS